MTKPHKIFFAILLLCVTGFAYPSKPNGYVNDYANILSAENKNALEQILRTYDKQTSIELVVVTIPSLEGQSIEEYTIGLAKTWKIGKSGKDNGIVFLTAPNEKKTRIEVGYGLEGDLTDFDAKQIIQQKIIPQFKAKDLNAGIVAGTNALIEKLGQTPYQTRKEERAAKEAASAENRKKIGNFLFQMAMFLGICISVVGILYLIHKGLKRFFLKRRNSKKISLIKASIENAYVEAKTKVNELQRLLPSLPKTHSELTGWGKQTREDYSSDMSAITSITEQNKREPEKVEYLLKKTHQLESTKRCVEKLQKRIDNFKKNEREAPGEVAAIASEIDKISKRLETFDKAGYRGHTSQWSSLMLDFVAGRELLKQSPADPEGAMEQCRVARNKAQEVLQQSVATDELRTRNEENIKGKILYASQVLQLKDKGRKTLGMLQTTYPESAWRDIAVKFENVPDISEKTFLNAQLNQVRELNGMDQQKFNEAESKLDWIHEKISEVERVVGLLENRVKKLKETKELIPQLREEVLAAEKKAEKAIEKNNTTSAQNFLAEGKKLAEEARKLEAAAMVDWLVLFTLYTGAISNFESAHKAAPAKSSGSGHRKTTRQKASDDDDDGFVAIPSATRNSSPTEIFSGGGGDFGGGGASGDWND